MRFKQRRFGGIMVIALSVVAICAATHAEGNLIRNGDFESPLKGTWSMNHFGKAHSLKADIVTAERKDGSAAVRLTGSRSFLSQTNIKLEKGVRYKLSGWVKSLDAPKAELYLLLMKAGEPSTEISVGFVSGNKDWTYLETTFDSADFKAAGAWLYLSGLTTGTAWFDGIELRKTSKAQSDNLLWNSGFNICGNPGIPDYWGVQTGTAQRRVADWESGRYYGVDEAAQSPVPGTKALRLVNAEKGVFPLWTANYLRNLPKGEYVLSAYLKADREGLPVQLVVGTHSTKREEFKIGTEWKRYFVATELPERIVCRVSFTEKGTLLVAAPQLEEGSEPSAYKPSPRDADLAPSAFAAEDASVPQFQCPVVDNAPALDGTLTDKAWDKAYKAVGFKAAKGDGTSSAAEGVIMRDANNLYVGFRCSEPEASKLRRGKASKEAEVYKLNTVELFLQPAPDSGKYYQISSNPEGDVYDAEGYDLRWSSGTTAKAVVGADFWTVEMAIPLSSLELGGASSCWGVGLGVARLLPDRAECHSWPMADVFHRPARFARMAGMASKDPGQVSSSKNATCANLNVITQYSFYTNDEFAPLQIKWEGRAKGNFELAVSGKEGQRVFSRSLELGGSPKIFNLPLAEIPGGEYEVKVSANDGADTVSASTKLLKLPPNAVEVRTDRFRRCFTVGGQSIISACHIVADRSDATLAALGGYGFHLLCNFSNPARTYDQKDLEAMSAWLDKCQAGNFKVIVRLDAKIHGDVRGKKLKGDELFAQTKVRLVSSVRKFKHHPAVLAWYFADEPGPHLKDWLGLEEDFLSRLYAAIKTEDPYHPAFVNWQRQATAGTKPYGSFNCTDVAALDSYVFNVHPKPEPLRDFSMDCKKWNEMASPLGLPIYFWMQVYGYNDAGREPTPEELKCMVYLNLIYGVRVPAYYDEGNPMCAALWEMEVELNAQVIKLAEALFSKPEARELKTGVLSDSVHYGLWSSGDAFYLILANVSRNAVDFSIDIGEASGESPDTAELIFEGWTQALVDGKLEGRLQGGQSHVYRLKKERAWYEWFQCF